MVSTRVRVTHCTARPRQALAHYPELFTLPPHCVLGLGVSEPAHAEHLAMTSTWVEEQGLRRRLPCTGRNLAGGIAQQRVLMTLNLMRTRVSRAPACPLRSVRCTAGPDNLDRGLERELSGRVASWPGIDTPRYVWNSTSSRMGWCRERPTCDLLDILCRIWLI